MAREHLDPFSILEPLGADPSERGAVATRLASMVGADYDYILTNWTRPQSRRVEEFTRLAVDEAERRKRGVGLPRVDPRESQIGADDWLVKLRRRRSAEYLEKEVTERQLRWCTHDSDRSSSGGRLSGSSESQAGHPFSVRTSPTARDRQRPSIVRRFKSLCASTVAK